VTKKRSKPKGFSPAGSGGMLGGLMGGGAKKTPKQAKTAGFSGSYAKILGVLSEGEIENLEQIYIDETPITKTLTFDPGSTQYRKLNSYDARNDFLVSWGWCLYS
jgi:hypothetical protein